MRTRLTLGAPACCRLTPPQPPTPATCRRPGLSLSRAGLGISALAFYLALACSAGADSIPIRIDTKLDQGLLEVRYKGNKLLVYAFATNQYKPYVRELYTLRGENVTRDAPPDHLHHHGLMYAVNINGVNYWEERVTPGI